MVLRMTDHGIHAVAVRIGQDYANYNNLRAQYINYNSAYWMNLYELWTNFPTREMTSLMKSYYLLQLAFWLQQILVINFEKRRKDYFQMLTHHLITSVLLATSYTYYQTKVGNVILCLVDVVDALFAVSNSVDHAIGSC